MTDTKIDLTAAIEAVASYDGYGQLHAQAAVERALPHLLAQIREGIAAEIHYYADSVYDLIDSSNGAQLAFERIEDIARNYGGTK